MKGGGDKSGCSLSRLIDARSQKAVHKMFVDSAAEPCCCCVSSLSGIPANEVQFVVCACIEIRVILSVMSLLMPHFSGTRLVFLPYLAMYGIGLQLSTPVYETMYPTQLCEVSGCCSRASVACLVHGMSYDVQWMARSSSDGCPGVRPSCFCT